MRYELQFTNKDVERVLNTWKEKCVDNKDEKEWVGTVIIHDLVSPMFGLRDLSSITDSRYLLHERKTNNGKYSEFVKVKYLTDIVQRAFAHNLHLMGMEYARLCYELLGNVSGNKKNNNLERTISHFHDTLREIGEYSPMTEKMQQITPLTEQQLWYCKRADISSEMIIYITNKFFSSDFKRDSYILKDDVSVFWTNVKDIIEADGIHVTYGKVHKIETKADYLTNAIEPLVWNVVQHAFNPKNDVNNRADQEKFWKGIGIFGYPETEVVEKYEGTTGLKKPAEQGNYIVNVKDTGFGISPEIMPYIFDKGFSTKEQSSDIEQGMGLWGVKQFVEKYGGNITVESIQDKGTSFKFTIPYTHLNDFLIIQ